MGYAPYHLTDNFYHSFCNFKSHGEIKRALFIVSRGVLFMNAKKSPKGTSDVKKNESALKEIKKIETSVKSLSGNLDKLKTLFKKKETKKTQ